MIILDFDIAVIGGGPAGLAAAIEAKKKGANKVVLLERDIELGGILQQCIHDGFGIHRFKERMSGNLYAQQFINEIEDMDIKVYLNTMVLEVTKDKAIYACNEKDGMVKINAKAVIFTMGCRERTAHQVLIHGTRPAGVMTAGTVQRYINIEGYLPGKKAVILGSGDIGLIMARRMKLEGIEVEGVYELMSTLGGLVRNKVQCLDDFDIPFHSSTTVTKIHGNNRVDRVTIAKVDEDRNIIEGSSRDIDCDLLVLAVGLIPENELSKEIGIVMDKNTGGPILDEDFMTTEPGFFAAGNVSVVFDLVDYVSLSAEIAARGAVDYINKEQEDYDYLDVEIEGNLGFVIPQRIRRAKEKKKRTFFMRVKEQNPRARLTMYEDGEKSSSKTCVFISPPEMLAYEIEIDGTKPLTLEMKNLGEKK